jgi:glutamate N-acetyltransferase/amino-acid N-acetyltransferase
LNSLDFPLGFKAATTNVGFKAQEINRKKVLQFSCIRLEVPGKWSAVYTRNPICGHPVTIGRKLLEGKKPIKAVWINNKIANVGSVHGLQDAEEISSTLANKLQCENDQIVPLSTGIIGWRLPKNEIISASSHVVKGSISAAEAARAIMTTDSYPKAFAEKLSNGAQILGIAKGAGMIEPNMGTVLVILMTDAAQEQEYMDKALKECINETFNCISIDSDTSTSDAAVLVSSGLKSQVDNEEFSEALMKVCKFLARQVVWNGEGVQHVIEVKIKNSPDKNLAKLIGKNIVNSPLTKSAICGNDPNVGRIIGSMAREVKGVDWSLVNVKLGEQFIFKKGSIVEWN